MKTGTDGLVSVVASTCNPEKEAAYNKWYEKHMMMVFKLETMVRASRYRCYHQVQDGDYYANYLTLYEFGIKDAVEAFPASPEFIAAGENYEVEGQYLTINLWAGWYEFVRSVQGGNESNSALLITGYEGKPGNDAGLDKWLDQQKRSTVEFPGLKSIGWYRLHVPINDTECLRYLNFCEFESKEALEAFPGSRPAAGIEAEIKNGLIDGPGLSVNWQARYERTLLFERD